MSPKSAQRFWENDMHEMRSMSPKSVQRFWENDMHKNKDLKRVAKSVSTRRALRFCAASGLVVDQPSEQFELLRQRVVGARKVLDLAHGMEHGRMVAAAEAPPDLRQ